ncbi:unnamed protein product [Candidula unifasciata]|uniref:G-protein coupled receptors family 1 profile domain-containing protein n=1 Tax=Candidula unifasciata TaxID=100452 RepID=A0A8S3YEG5_9EUPU|nr:unnamed protein product [Candidula unifasciata]
MTSVASETPMLHRLPAESSDLISDASVYWIRISLGFVVHPTVLLSPTESIDLISDESVDFIRFTLGFILDFPILIFGMSANIINMVVYIKIGVGDTVSVSFFALSIVHFGCIFFYFAGRVFFVLEKIFNVESYIDLGAVFHLVAFYNYLFKDMADGVIVFIAVQKCCCVAIPLHFKNTFTYARSVSALVIMFLAALAYYLPAFTGQRLGPVVDSLTNTTRLVYTYHPRILILIRISKVLNGLILPVLSHSFVVLCSVVLSIKLKRAVSFRNSRPANKKVKTNTKLLFSKETFPKLDLLHQESGKLGFPKRRLQKLKGKELKVVQAVYFTAILFIASNIRNVPIKFVGFFVPDLQDICGSRYYNTYVLVTSVQSLLDHLGTALHLFIYVKFNRMYRRKLKALFCSDKPTTRDQRQGWKLKALFCSDKPTTRDQRQGWKVESLVL